MARFTDAFTAPAIAAIVNEDASNRIPYLGEGLSLVFRRAVLRSSGSSRTSDFL